jgi:hypothetical protein
MSRMVIVTLIYHRHKPTDLRQQSSFYIIMIAVHSLPAESKVLSFNNSIKFFIYFRDKLNSQWPSKGSWQNTNNSKNEKNEGVGTLRVLRDSYHWQTALQITDPSSRQRGRPKTKSKAIFRQNKRKKQNLVMGPEGVPDTKTCWLTDHQS